MVQLLSEQFGKVMTKLFHPHLDIYTPGNVHSKTAQMFTVALFIISKK